MERCGVSLNLPELFDRAVHGDDHVPALPSGDDLHIITKDGGMRSGRSVAVITWTCMTEGGLKRAQYSVSIRQLKMALRILDAHYTDDGLPR